MKKILYILNSYPQLSQTYIHTEMNALVEKGYDVHIIGLREPNFATSNHLPYEIISDIAEIISYAKSLKPDFIHTHWIFHALPIIYKVSKTINTPFTVRTHSFDILWRNNPLKKRIKAFIHSIRYTKILNDPLCKGVLVFPFGKKLLIKSGIKKEKIIETFPVVDFEKFYNKSENGKQIINMGSAIHKKNFKDFMLLAKETPGLYFNLYAIGYAKKEFKEQNKQLGTPVIFCDEVEHDQMPLIYKKHQWLVYTADSIYAKVGWPLAALEAMASGVGVCLPNIRPDMKDYIGDAGIIYSDPNELKDIITKPVPPHMREKGFELARKYDIRKQIHLLTNLWE